MKALVSKTSIGVSLSRVRIPPSPQNNWQCGTKGAYKNPKKENLTTEGAENAEKRIGKENEEYLLRDLSVL